MKFIFMVMIFCTYIMACGWVNGTTIDGRWQERGGGARDHSGISSLISGSQENAINVYWYFNKTFSDAEKENNVTKAVLSMLHGKYDLAIKQLHIEEAKTPNTYEIAANLGTAYELFGNNEKALKWIQRGIEINSSSHHGSEWLHEDILKTKLLLEKDPMYLNTHHVINSEYMEYVGPDRIKEAIIYQLRERLLFVKPKDIVVADLLYILATLHADTGGFLEESLALLDLSQTYGYLNSLELQETKQNIKAIMEKTQWMRYVKIVVFFILPFFILLYIGYKKKMFFLTRGAQQRYKDSRTQDDVEEDEYIVVLEPKKSSAMKTIGDWFILFGVGIIGINVVVIFQKDILVMPGFFIGVLLMIVGLFFRSNAKS